MKAEEDRPLSRDEQQLQLIRNSVFAAAHQGVPPEQIRAAVQEALAASAENDRRARAAAARAADRRLGRVTPIRAAP